MSPSTRTPNGAIDLFDDGATDRNPISSPTELATDLTRSPAVHVNEAAGVTHNTSEAASYVIDEDDDLPTPALSTSQRGGDPCGEGEREPCTTRKGTSTATASHGSKWSSKEANLSEKTCKIMSDYQTYLAEIATEFPSSNYSVAKNNSHRSSVHQEDGTTLEPYEDAEKGQSESKELYRDWSYKDEPQDSLPLTIDRIGEGVADFEDHPHAMLSRGRTNAQSLFSKRVKRGLFMLIVVTFIIALSVALSTKKKAANLPDWEGQYAEIEGNAMAQAPSDQQSSPPTNFTFNFGIEWFTRSTNWKGQTYAEAVGFCAAIDSGKHKVCPYGAICPLGYGSMPSGGFRNDGVEGMSWVPVSDSINSWISVSSKEPCLPFLYVYETQPEWGLTGKDDEDITRNLACCLNHDSPEEAITSVADLNETISSMTKSTTAADSLIADAIAGKIENAAEINHVYQVVTMTWQPRWFDRSKGWEGQTYLESVTFCASQPDQLSLCPLEAICPLGPGSIPIGGVHSEPNGSWTPVSNAANAWVHVSPIDSCIIYDALNDGNKPEWGLSGEGNEDITRHIACCIAPSKIFGSENQNPSTTTSTVGSSPEEVKAEGMQTAATTVSTVSVASDEGVTSETEVSTTSTMISTEKVNLDEPLMQAPSSDEEVQPDMSFETVVSDLQTTAATEATVETSPEEEEAVKIMTLVQTYKPRWFDRSEWSGQTYAEAIQFCATHDSGILCPYIVLCLKGGGNNPYGGIKTGYSPVFNHPNEWVSIGSEGTCKTYSELEGSPPEWGLTGDGNEELTRNILCCVDYEEENKINVTTQELVSDQTKINYTSEELAIMDSFKPQWYGREDGYQGTTYQAAIDFCSNVAGMLLCPIGAYCPNRPLNRDLPPLFLRLDAYEDEQWAPFAVSDDNSSDHYVLIGTLFRNPQSTCSTYEDLLGHAPSWMSSGDSTQKKQYVLCCKDPSYSAAADSDVTDVVNQTEDSPTLQDGTFDVEQAIFIELDPVWIDGEDGWEGGSHDDAQKFCENIIGKELCPYAAYCPHGPGQPVIGKHDVDFTSQGIQWAPTYGTNEWVLISQKAGNSATTCMTHTDLEGIAPDWGLTSGRPWLKKNLMCCKLRDS